MTNIKDVFESILVYSQDYPFELDTTNLFRQWETAKHSFLSATKGASIIRSAEPVKIVLSEKQKADRFNSFISALDDNEILTMDLEKFLRQNERGFFENRVLKEYPEKGVQQGSKISKSFKRFILDKDVVRCAQDIASRFIQENKIEGYLYLSVDPRDFLTLSENNEHWWSCQTLDGDFRAGNLSYMVDSSTIVAYLSSGRDEQLKCTCSGITWNSKKWRMLIHTDYKNVIYYNRQYPYNSDTLMEKVHQMVLQYLIKEKAGWIQPYKFGFKIPGEELIGDNYLYAGGRVFKAEDVINIDNYLGYSDLTTSNSYEPIISVQENQLIDYKEKYSILGGPFKEEVEAFLNIFKISIGEKPICPCCGERVVLRDDSFLCPMCIAEKDADEDFYLTCDYCGHRVYDEDEAFWIDNEFYCENCYKEIMEDA